MSDPKGDRGKAQLAVIGGGLAGLAAGLFAARAGLDVVRIGPSGPLNFASGLLDLMAVHPVVEGRRWADPWACLTALAEDEPFHPLARIPADDIRAAFSDLLAELAAGGLAYHCREERNTAALTPVGSVKATWCLPQTMRPGAAALADRRPALIVDFIQLKDFSVAQVVQSLAGEWPGLRSASVPNPTDDSGREIFTGDVLALAFERPGSLERLAQSIRPLLGDAQSVGLPAVLGMTDPGRTVADLAALLDREVFEIPTPPVSVPGIRLQRVLGAGLRRAGGLAVPNQRVIRAEFPDGAGFRLGLGSAAPGAEPNRWLEVEAVILAPGRFTGGGLIADRFSITEPLFGLPVTGPGQRSQWHATRFFDPAGHPVNRAGVEVDGLFRPLAGDGDPVHPRLFAVGSILAHQDWVRQKCGAGLALATARAAVQSVIETQ